MNMPDHLTTTPPPAATARRRARRAPLRAAFGRLFAQGNEGGPPDLEEMWRDFTRKLANFFGAGKRGGEGGGNGGGGGGGFQPDVKSAWVGIGLVGAIVVVVWLFSGSFIVQEGQQAIVTTFGRYSRTVDAGWGWRLPYPIQQQEIVDVTPLRTAEIGDANVSQMTGLRGSSMLTQDENIVDVRFNVQYRLRTNEARQYLFDNSAPDNAVVQASESAVREIVGSRTIDSVLYEQRDAFAASLVKSIQVQLDTVASGIEIVNVNVENVSVPPEVQAEFDDAFKAGADRDRFKNEGQAYASDVIPKAKGDAAAMRLDAEAYKASIVGAAQGDADRFKAVQAEYAKAPAITRDRMYIDTMREVYQNVTKVLVDTHGGTNLIQVPIDKLTQAGAANAAAQQPGSSSGGAVSGASSGGASAGTVADTPAVTLDPRSRDNSRSRDRDR